MLRFVPETFSLLCGILQDTSCQGGLQSGRGTHREAHGAEDSRCTQHHLVWLQDASTIQEFHRRLSLWPFNWANLRAAFERWFRTKFNSTLAQRFTANSTQFLCKYVSVSTVLEYWYLGLQAILPEVVEGLPRPKSYMGRGVLFQG